MVRYRHQSTTSFVHPMSLSSMSISISPSSAKFIKSSRSSNTSTSANRQTGDCWQFQSSSSRLHSSSIDGMCPQHPCVAASHSHIGSPSTVRRAPQIATLFPHSSTAAPQSMSASGT